MTKQKTSNNNWQLDFFHINRAYSITFEIYHELSFVLNVREKKIKILRKYHRNIYVLQ